MNFAKHAAWMMNPNLSRDDVLRLVEKDFAREEEMLHQVIEDAKEVARKHGRQVALDYLAQMLPLVLCH